MTPIRVAIVEDEPLYRGLLEHYFERHPRLDVVGSYADGAAALAGVPATRPDVVTLDIELAGRVDGIQVGVALRQKLSQLGIVILSNHADPRFLGALPREVTSGWSYLLKKYQSDQFRPSILRRRAAEYGTRSALAIRSRSGSR
jgi:DNA-binding NarL/FixJ family response regulator